MNKEELLSNVDNQRASSSRYAGDYIEENQTPLENSGFRCLEFEDASEMLCFYDPFLLSGKVTFYPWQIEIHEEMARSKPTAKHPHKHCLVAANGSGKDAFIAAPFCVWFTLCKIKSRVILTTSSGTQLTGQTEPAIKRICELVNTYHGEEIFKIRQRYIYCRLTGSEIRMFATDEAGKAEGYHPIEPGSEMAIVVNEGKSVTEEIHNALRRCTGFNYWLEYSSPGEPNGFFYNAAKTWPHVRTITSFDCPEHLSAEEREQDKIDLGEHSALYRSKHLAEFTSLGGDVVITTELLNKCLANPCLFTTLGIRDGIGIDLAAGGDENWLCHTKANKLHKEAGFRETDTTITAERIDRILRDWGIAKDYKHIYADDGGIGRAIIDMLIRKGWKINRVMNQWPAFNKREFGNRGAENWYRTKRIFEENMFDFTNASADTKKQLVQRHYRQASTGAKIYLEAKREAKLHGRPSPDRADAFILALTGLTVDDFLKAKPIENKGPVAKNEGETILNTADDVAIYFENEVKYAVFNNKSFERTRRSKRHCCYQLSSIYRKN